MTNVYFVNHPWHEAGGCSGGCDGLFHLLSPPLCPRQLRVCQVVCNCLDLCLKNLENKLHVIVQFILTRDSFQCETIPEREKKCQRYISDDSGRRYTIHAYDFHRWALSLFFGFCAFALMVRSQKGSAIVQYPFKSSFHLKPYCSVVHGLVCWSGSSPCPGTGAS